MVHHLHFAVVVVRRRMNLGHGHSLLGKVAPDDVVRVWNFPQCLHCKVWDQISPAYVRRVNVVLVV